MSQTATSEVEDTVTRDEAREGVGLARVEGAEDPGTWLTELESHVWAMRPESLATLQRLAASGQLANELQAKVTVDASEAARRRGRPSNINGGVARIPLKGVLMPMGGLLAMLFGLENPLDSFKRALREALGSDEVGAVVLDIDSPGGVVDGIPEAAAELRKVRGSKPIVASVNTMAASAAYWIAAQADEIAVTPSGVAGSIGVYQMHRDMSGAMKLMGVETTFISAGKYKTEGHPFAPLSDEARTHMQEEVDYFYDLFTKDVALGRNAKAADVRGGYGEGRVLVAKQAVSEGLADRVETLDETIARLTRRGRGGAVLRADATTEANAGVDELDEPEAEANAGADTEEQAAPTRLTAEEKDRIWSMLDAGLFEKTINKED